MLQNHKNFKIIVNKVVIQSSTQRKKIERLISKQNKVYFNRAEDF